MRKIAVYGKGGIGKSTITSSLSAAIASMGQRVIQIGCDPKADSTLNLTGGRKTVPVIHYLRDHGGCESLEEIATIGYKNIVCFEAGGPSPGVGCAGRGIVTTFELLDELEAFETYRPDFVFYDVLGDVVCGGFAMPMRNGYADEVIVVTSGEKMALFAAGNIIEAVDTFRERNGIELLGIILNKRNVEKEEKMVRTFAERCGADILGVVERDKNIQLFENKNQTVIEGDPKLPISRTFMSIATSLLNGKVK
jgi:nitrogenase iron protein NifH